MKGPSTKRPQKAIASLANLRELEWIYRLDVTPDCLRDYMLGRKLFDWLLDIAIQAPHHSNPFFFGVVCMVLS
jgi:hypothetical protein